MDIMISNLSIDLIDTTDHDTVNVWETYTLKGEPDDTIGGAKLPIVYQYSYNIIHN